MTLYFISDLHLHPDRPAVTERFFRFLQNDAQEAEALYILGDFFEVFIGEDAFSAHDKQVIEALTAYAKKVPTYFMHGNRDFLFKASFFKQRGITFLSDPTLIHHNGKKILLMHGDSLCSKDVSYQWFRRFVRHPFIQWLYLSLPLSFRRSIAQKIRDRSSSHTYTDVFRDLSRYDVTESAIQAMARTHPFDILIHGHTHKPGVHHSIIENNTAIQRFVLGDWGNISTILKWKIEHGELLNIMI